MVSVDNFKLRYPEFKGKDNTLVQMILDEASLSIDKRIYHKKYEAALFALTAHLIYLNSIANGEVAGGSISGMQQVTSEKAGELQLSYSARTSTGNAIDDDYMSTIYGQTYIRLRDEVKPKIGVAHRGFKLP